MPRGPARVVKKSYCFFEKGIFPESIFYTWSGVIFSSPKKPYQVGKSKKEKGYGKRP